MLQPNVMLYLQPIQNQIRPMLNWHFIDQGSNLDVEFLIEENREDSKNVGPRTISEKE